MSKVLKGNGNPLVFRAGFQGDFKKDGFNNFNKIEFKIGDETYDSTSHPDNIVVTSKTELRVMIGKLTSLEKGNYRVEITGYSDTYQDGYLLTGEQIPNIPLIPVV